MAQRLLQARPLLVQRAEPHPQTRDFFGAVARLPLPLLQLLGRAAARVPLPLHLGQ
jgi:hypothetical protein